MTYIDTETNEYPLFIGDLMLRTGLPENEAATNFRYAAVDNTIPPTTTPENRVIELKPTFDGLVWRKQFLIRPETEEEKVVRLEFEARERAGFEAQYGSSGLSVDAAGSVPDVVG